MGKPASPDHWRRWRAAHRAYRERERERERARRRAGYRSPKTRRPRTEPEPIELDTHPPLTRAMARAASCAAADPGPSQGADLAPNDRCRAAGSPLLEASITGRRDNPPTNVDDACPIVLTQ